MTALRFALGAAACVLLPAVLAGAVAGLLYDRCERRRDWQRQWNDLVDEASSWLNQEASA